MEPRYIIDRIEADIADRMIFIGGPRQVGKTTLAISLLGQGQNESSPAYLNWDVLTDREDILAGRLPSGQTRVIFDEIHKLRAMAKSNEGVIRQKQDIYFLYRYRLGTAGLLSQRWRLIAGALSLLPSSSLHADGMRTGVR